MVARDIENTKAWYAICLAALRPSDTVHGASAMNANLSTDMEPMKPKHPTVICINTDWCKGCDICAAFCPKQVLVMNQRDKAEVVAAENCIACKQCEQRCPDLAIQVIKSPAKEEKEAS